MFPDTTARAGSGVVRIDPLHFLAISEMTYTVSSGTLNSTIPYHPRYDMYQVGQKTGTTLFYGL